ncbi:MAG: hypothetical protein OIN66_07575 [Candidatus Methanoperedens sp.]|nr:hypothetical protein [Candidatus Methanoperedens sp.]
MVKDLEDMLDGLYNVEGVEACILYRIDGVPIILKAHEYREHLLETMFWLEKQIKHVLGEMNKEGLNETIFFFRNNRIQIMPSSKSTVLVTITNTETHDYLTSIEALRTSKIVEKNIS